MSTPSVSICDILSAKFSHRLSLLSYRVQTSHVTAERDAQVKSAQRSLQTHVEPARIRRAELKLREERVREIWEGLEATRKANESSKYYPYL